MKSVVDAVGTLTVDIKSGFNQKQLAGCIFLDVEGAFDNVDIFLLGKLLIRLGLPRNFVKLIFNLTNCRKIIGFNDGQSLGTKFACKGLPQGSILNPILFNIYTSQLPCAIPP